MRNERGSTSIDIMAATCLLLLVVMAIAACFQTGTIITRSNMQINSYEANVVTKLTSLESLNALQLYELNNTQEVVGGINYSYVCSKSNCNTIHAEVKAVYKSFNYTFIVETVDTDHLVN